MKLILKLGYRNLWRNRRRTLLTMSAMAVATMMVILMLGIYDGMLWDMIENATEMYHGHVKITADGYLDQRKVHLTIEEDGYRQTILDDQRIKGVSGRVRSFMLLSHGEGAGSHTQPAELLGISPDEERTVTQLESHVTEGTYLTGPDTKGILLGDGLARRLEAELGGEIIAMGQGADGSIAAEIFIVTGIIDTGDPLRDSMLAIVGRTTLQELVVLEGQLHEWTVLLKRPLDAALWATEKSSQFEGAEVSPWQSFLPAIGQMWDMWKAIKFIFAFIFYFAVILVASNTMYMAFFERLREFGIMGAIGLRLRSLSLMIVMEGLIMSGIAGISGGIVGTIATYILSIHYIDGSRFLSSVSYAGTVITPRIRCYFDLENILIPILMITALGMIVAMFPAWRLRKLRPVDVLREV